MSNQAEFDLNQYISCDASNISFDLDGFGPYSKGVGWKILSQQFQASIFMFLILAVFSIFAHWRAKAALKNRGTYYYFVTTYMGLDPEAPDRPLANGIMYGVQLIGSSVTVALWVYKSYERCDTPNWVFLVEDILAGIFCFQFVWNSGRSSMSLSYLLSLGSLVDIITIAPLMFRGFVEESWIDLGHLRAFRVLQAFTRLIESGVLQNISDFQCSVISAILRTLSMVVCMAGTAFLLEVIGEIPDLNDDPIDTKMGAISFVQCFYWVFTTISTVGYGDFSPTTIPARLFAIFCIIGGVIFFSTESANVIEVTYLMQNGRGKYAPTSWNGEHILVLGGAVTTYTDLLHDFLKEFLHPEHNDDTDVVLMSSAPPDPELQAKLKEAWMENRVIYLQGSVAEPADGLRARLSSCKMAFVLGDTNTADPDWEDEQNIVRAVAAVRACPTVKLRLMLLRPENRELALRVGIQRHFCYAINELKVNLMSQSCRCPGWSTLLLNLAESSTLSHEDPCHGLSPEEIGKDSAGWNAQYCWGESHEIQGCAAHARYAGKSYCDAALEMMEQHGIILLAVQVDGQLMVGPLKYILQESDVMFCISQSEDALNAVKVIDPEAPHWTSKFRGNRNGKVAPDKEKRRRYFDQERKFKVKDNLGDSIDDDKVTALKHDANVTDLKQTSTTISAIERLKRASKAANTISLGALQFKGFKAAAPKANDIPTEVLWTPAASVGEHHNVTTIDADYVNNPHRHNDQNVVDTNVHIERARQTQKKGHIVLLGPTSGLFQQIVAFLRPLREAYLARKFPVIVICPEACPVHIASLPGFENVAFLHLHPMKADTLENWVNPQTADKVILLSGQPETTDSNMVDSKNIIISNTLEEYLDMEGMTFNNSECFLFFEMFNPDNTRLLPLLDREWMRKIEVIEPHCSDVKYSWRYSCGSLMFGAKLGSLLALAYYTPGVMEIFEAMCIPARRDQVAMPWRVRVPEDYFGRPWRDLVKDLLSGNFARGCIENKTEAVEPFSPTSRRRRKTSIGAQVHLQTNLEALPLGLFRSPGKNGSLLGFVFTCPPMTTVLAKGDFVFCTAPPTFGHAVVGLLTEIDGDLPRPEATDPYREPAEPGSDNPNPEH